MRYHIHINLIDAGAADVGRLVALGFQERPFENRRPFDSHFTPRQHLSCHLATQAEFKSKFASAAVLLDQGKSTVGYMEGEYVARQETYPPDPVAAEPKHKSPPPCLRLHLSPPLRWRQSEVHLTLKRTPTSERHLEYFRTAGFYRASMHKADGEHIIFTAQGPKVIVGLIYTFVHSYMCTEGRMLSGKLKEERSLKFWISRDYTWLMPQVSSVVFE